MAVIEDRGQGAEAVCTVALCLAIHSNEKTIPALRADADANQARCHRETELTVTPNEDLNECCKCCQACHRARSREGQQTWRYRGLATEVPRSNLGVRMRGFTFAWFTVSMGTGGLSLLLARIPAAYRFTGLDVIGRIVFIIDLAIFIGLHIGLFLRFRQYPHAFRTMLSHPAESSYLCAWLQALATLLVNIATFGFDYTGRWLRTTVLVLWLIESSLAVILSVTLPLIHFRGHPDAQEEMPPSFMLMPTIIIYATTVSDAFISQLPVETAMWVYWLTYCLQGFGTFLSIFYLALWFGKQLSGGLYRDNHALTPFMIVGMTSYAADGFFSLGRNARSLFPAYAALVGQDFLRSSSANSIPSVTVGEIFYLFNLALGLLWYGFAWWCLLISATMTIYVIVQKRASPSLSAMFSAAFPTTGIIIDTWTIAEDLGENGMPSGARWLIIFGIVMLFVWIIAYLAGLSGIAYKVWSRQLLWEGKDDNKPLMGYSGEFYLQSDQLSKGA